MKNRKVYKISMLLILVWSMIGCSAKSSDPGKAGDGINNGEEKHDPVTITISRDKSYEPDAYDQMVQQEVAKAYPYITVNWIHATGGEMEKQVAAGTVPDLYYVNAVGLQGMKKLQLESGLNGLIKQFNFDLGKLTPGALDMVRTVSGEKDLYALPYAIGFPALFYNKDLFDKFGQPYPRDNMTWDEITELAKKMVRFDQGVQYQGLGIAPPSIIFSQLSLPMADQASGQSKFNTEGWHKAFAMLKQLFDSGSKDLKGFDGLNNFLKDKSLAMLAAYNFTSQFNADPSLNWDMVTLPSFKEAPNITTQQAGVMVAMTSVSKHREDAFRVMSVILSKPVQTEMAKISTRPTVLKDKTVQQEFINLPGFKGKNIASIFLSTPAKGVAATDYDNIVLKAANQTLAEVLQGSKDINSALVEAEDVANQGISDLVSKK